MKRLTWALADPGTMLSDSADRVSFCCGLRNSGFQSSADARVGQTAPTAMAANNFSSISRRVIAGDGITDGRVRAKSLGTDIARTADPSLVLGFACGRLGM